MAEPTAGLVLSAGAITSSLHVLVACLAAKQHYEAAGRMACANWIVKLWCVLKCALRWGGPPCWQAVLASNTFFLTSACSACLDFYQLQEGHLLGPLVIMGMNTCTAASLAFCLERSKEQLGIPHDWLRTLAGLLLSMVCAPRLTDALLRLCIVHDCTSHPGQTTSPAQTAAFKAPAQTARQPLLQLACRWCGTATVRQACSVLVTLFHRQACEQGATEQEKQPQAGVPCRQSDSPRFMLPAAQPVQQSECHSHSNPVDAGLERSMHADPASAGQLQQPSHAYQVAAHTADWHTGTRRYKSNLGHTSKVCVKVPTNKQLSDIPTDMVVQLRSALSQIPGVSYHLMGMAARPGCILLSMDLRVDGDHPAPITTGAAAGTSRHASHQSTVAVPDDESNRLRQQQPQQHVGMLQGSEAQLLGTVHATGSEQNCAAMHQHSADEGPMDGMHRGSACGGVRSSSRSTTATGFGTTAASDMSCAVLAMSQAVAPVMAPLMGGMQQGIAGASSKQAVYEQLTFSVDGLLMTAQYDEGSCSWLVQPVDENACGGLQASLSCQPRASVGGSVTEPAHDPSSPSAGGYGTGSKQATPLPPAYQKQGMPSVLLAITHAEWQPCHGVCVSTIPCRPTASGSVQRPGASSALVTPSSTRVTHTAAMRVRVLPVSSAASCAATCIAKVVGGWEPADAGMHELAAGPHTYQLLARCESSYLTTKVWRSTHSSTLDDQASNAPASTMGQELLVDVEVPDDLLPRHHTGAAPVGLLPFTLELWQGVHCVTSLPNLLPLTFRPGADVNVPVASVRPSSVWWWGATAQCVVQAVQELQGISAQLQQAVLEHGRTPTTLYNWHEFMADLSTWLTHVRQACTSTPAHCLCTMPIAPAGIGICTQIPIPTLGPAALQMLGQDVAMYAQSVGLKHVHTMLQQQLAVVRQCVAAVKADSMHIRPAPCIHGPATTCLPSRPSTSRTPAPSSPSSPLPPPSPTRCRQGYRGQAYSTAQLLRASLLRFPCTQCEARCKACMSQQLALSQMYCSAALAVMGMVSFLRGCMQRSPVYAWLPCSLLHALLWLNHRHKYCSSQQHRAAAVGGHASSSVQGRHSPQPPLSCGVLSLLVWAYRVMVYMLYAAGVVTPDEPLQLFLKTRIVLIHTIFLAVGEQLQVAVQVPMPGAILFIGLFEAATNYLAAYHIGAAGATLLIGLPLCAVIPPLAMNMRMRAAITRSWSSGPAARQLAGLQTERAASGSGGAGLPAAVGASGTGRAGLPTSGRQSEATDQLVGPGSGSRQHWKQE